MNFVKAIFGLLILYFSSQGPHHNHSEKLKIINGMIFDIKNPINIRFRPLDLTRAQAWEHWKGVVTPELLETRINYGKYIDENESFLKSLEKEKAFLIKCFSIFIILWALTMILTGIMFLDYLFPGVGAEYF